MAVATITQLRDLTKRMAYSQATQTILQEATLTIQMSSLTIPEETTIRVNIISSLQATVVTVVATHNIMSTDWSTQITLKDRRTQVTVAIVVEVET